MTRTERERGARMGAMIDAAEAVMGRKGYRDASMDEIAQASGFTKRTLYQYFLNKDDLYFAVAARLFQSLGEAAGAAIGPGPSRFPGGQAAPELGASGRLRAFFLVFARFFTSNPERARILTFVSQLGAGQEECPNYPAWDQAVAASFAGIADLVREGVAEGSLRPDLDPGRTALSLGFLATGFFNLLAVNGESFSRRYGLDPELFAASTLELLWASLARSGIGDVGGEGSSEGGSDGPAA